MSDIQIRGSSWQEVPDKDVRHVWQCRNDDCDEQPSVNVMPDYYQESGTPMCTECNKHMQYVRTEVRRKV